MNKRADRLDQEMMSCPDEELLAALAAGEVAPEGRNRLDLHLRSCDRCAEALVLAQRRIAVLGEIPARPAPELIRRAQEAFARVLPAARQAEVERADLVSSLREWFSRLFEVRVLVPVAGAALVLFALTSIVTTSDSGMGERTRAVRTDDRLRVTADTATVHTGPSDRSTVVSTLSRGADVTVTGEEGEWYSVLLADGSIGWVERRAFE